MLVTSISVLISSSIYWLLNTWANLTMDEIIFHLKVPLKGTNRDMISEAIWTGMIPCLVAIAIVWIVLRFTQGRKKPRIIFSGIVMTFAISLAAVMIYTIINRYNVAEYIVNRNDESTFIEENYVEPRSVKITFPEKKRNLVYIFLESMEKTYTSTENGGFSKENLIPELTDLADNNVSFSSDEKLGGGRAAACSTWTIAAMFAQTAGLPLDIPIGDDKIEEQEQFFPNIVTLGDVLHEQGYKQVLMFGSDADFGGRRNYFTQHGQYEIWDYLAAKEKQKIPQDYREFWGFEDQKLFQFAKEELTKLSQGDQPFNLTMLTVDTHFEDGYLCDLCVDEHDGNQYANVISCSSRQVSEFVEWISEQSFYENTTVVLVGDHLSMDMDFFKHVPKEYKRQVYNAFINAAAEPVREKNIDLTTMDFYPTTLASLGVRIEGERLALGTNLFSGQTTLMEEYGFEKINEEIAKRSLFYEQFTKEIVGTLGDWVEDENGRRFMRPDGTFIKDRWFYSKGIGYHFNEEGYVDRQFNQSQEK